jgi:hypothetical protein
MQVDDMESCNAGVFATPVRVTHGSGLSSQQPFQTLDNLIEDAFGNSECYYTSYGSCVGSINA